MAFKSRLKCLFLKPIFCILFATFLHFARNTTTKDEALRNLSKRLLHAGYISDVDQFVKDIYVREAEGPTGMGHKISIPHGKSSAVRKIGIAIGCCVQDVKWESCMSEDGYQDTNIIFLFCVSDDNNFAENHMKLLADLAGKLGNDNRVRKLQEVTSKSELIDVIINDSACVAEGEKTSDQEEETIEELDIDLI